MYKDSSKYSVYVLMEKYHIQKEERGLGEKRNVHMSMVETQTQSARMNEGGYMDGLDPSLKCQLSEN